MPPSRSCARCARATRVPPCRRRVVSARASSRASSRRALRRLIIRLVERARRCEVVARAIGRWHHGRRERWYRTHGARALEKRVPRVLVDRFHIVRVRRRRDHAAMRRPTCCGCTIFRMIRERASARRRQSSAVREIHLRERVAAIGVRTVFRGRVWGQAAVNHDIARRRRTVSSTREPPRDGVMRLIYHTTPHRGLDVLMRAFAKVYERYEGKVHLDVYFRFAVYGWTQRDAPLEHLFETCRRHAGCTYHGAVSNEEVREALQGRTCSRIRRRGWRRRGIPAPSRALKPPRVRCLVQSRGASRRRCADSERRIRTTTTRGCTLTRSSERSSAPSILIGNRRRFV